MRSVLRLKSRGDQLGCRARVRLARIEMRAFGEYGCGSRATECSERIVRREDSTWGHLCERCRDKTLPGLTLTRQHAAEARHLQHSAGTGCCLGRALILGVSGFPRGYQPKPAARLRSGPNIHIGPGPSSVIFHLRPPPYRFVLSGEIY
jgi:hypothetical protein